MSPTKESLTSRSVMRPTERKERFASLDVLRGVAVLGLLPVSIQTFAMASSTFADLPNDGVLIGTDGAIWILLHVFFEQKFDTILAVLLGAGIVLMAGRVLDHLQAADIKATPSAEKSKPLLFHQSKDVAFQLHNTRMLWMVALGIVQFFLFWHDDRLAIYALCGLAAYYFVNWQPEPLLRTGLLLITFGAVLMFLIGTYLGRLPLESYNQIVAQYWFLSPEAIAEQNSGLHGSWFQQIGWRARSIDILPTTLLSLVTFWRTLGLMLLGMAFLKQGILTGQRPTSWYALITVIGMLISLPLATTGIVQNVTHYWDMAYTVTIGAQFDYWASLLMASAYVSLILLLCKHQFLRRIKRMLAAMGRMSLSNYTIQFLVCGWIFYGHGLDLYGSLTRVDQMQIALALMIVQMIYSPFWLKAFHYGPLEWLWRSLTYRQTLPFIRHIAAARRRI